MLFMRFRFAQQMFHWWVHDQKHYGHTIGLTISPTELHYVYAPCSEMFPQLHGIGIRMCKKNHSCLCVLAMMKCRRKGMGPCA